MPRLQRFRQVFYGWWILAVSVLGAFLGAATSQLFTGAMLPDIEAATGWSRASITFAVTLGSIAGGLTAPFWGQLVDRHGPRVLTAVGALIVALAMFLIAISGLVHVALFYIGYIVARGVAQNAISGVVPRTTLVNWFRRKRGRALGMLSMAIPLGGAVLVPIAKLISTAFDWQVAYWVFGLLLLALLVPLALLVLRRRPEDLGLLPDGVDGVKAVEGPPEGSSSSDSADFTLQEALRTPAFWLLIIATTAGTCSNGGIGFHQAAYFKDQGIAAATIATAISVYALSGAFANGLWGFLVERISERILGSLTLFFAGLLPFYLLTVDSALGAISFAVLFGLAARGEGSIIVLIQAKYFGRDSFGAISGFSAPFQQAALGLGPTLGALIFEFSGRSYSYAFLFFGALFMVASALIFCARQPSRPSAGRGTKVVVRAPS